MIGKKDNGEIKKEKICDSKTQMNGTKSFFQFIKKKSSKRNEENSDVYSEPLSDYWCFEENENYFAIKPKDYSYSFEIDPNKILENMLNSENNFVFEIGADLNNFPDIYKKERENLIVLIRKMIENLKFTEQTFYQAVLFLDILLYKQDENLEMKLKIIAISSLILAAKFNENDPNIPNLSGFQSLNNRFYFYKDELKLAEISCLNQLKYNLSYYTPYQFLKIFLSFGFIFDSDLLLISLKPNESNYSQKKILNNLEKEEFENKMNGKTIEDIYKFSVNLLEYTTTNKKILDCLDSFKIACAVIAFTRDNLIKCHSKLENDEENLEQQKTSFKWTTILERIYSIEFGEFKIQFDIVKGCYKEFVRKSEEEKKIFEKHGEEIKPNFEKKHYKTKSCSNIILNDNHLGNKDIKKINLPIFSGSISTSNSYTQDNYFINNLASYNQTNRATVEKKYYYKYSYNQEKQENVLKSDIRRHNPELNDNLNSIKFINKNEYFHKERLPKSKRLNLEEIKIDEENIEKQNNVGYEKYFTSSKKPSYIEFDYDIKNSNVNKKEEMYNKYKKVEKSENKKENYQMKNDILLKKYEHYKNEDFEEYEKNFVQENFKNKNTIIIDENKERNSEFNRGYSENKKLSSNLENIYENNDADLKKHESETSNKSKREKKSNENHLKKEKSNSAVLDFVEDIIHEKDKLKKQTIENEINEKNDKLNDVQLNSDLNKIQINEINIRMNEEKINKIKEKINKIKSLETESITQNLNLQKKHSENSNLSNMTNIRSVSSKNNHVDKLFENNTHSQNTKINYDKLNGDKINKFINSNKNEEEISLSKKHNNINIKANSKDVSDKDYNKVLNNLKIDNILQKTKMIFSKQMSLNSNLNKKSKDTKEIDINKIKITHNIFAERKQDSLKDLYSNKYMINCNLYPESKMSSRNSNDSKTNFLYGKNINENLYKDNIINNAANPTSTIIINNNININTYIEKAHLSQEKITKKPDDISVEENSNLRPEYCINSKKDENRIQTGFGGNNKKNFKINYEETERENKNTNTKENLKDTYIRNNYKNLLLCSYEGNVKGKFNSHKVDNYVKIQKNFDKFESGESYLHNFEKKTSEYDLFYKKNKIRSENFDENKINENVSPNNVNKNKRLLRPHSYIRSIDFDNKINENLLDNKMQKNFNIYNKYDVSRRNQKLQY